MTVHRDFMGTQFRASSSGRYVGRDFNGELYSFDPSGMNASISKSTVVILGDSITNQNTYEPTQSEVYSQRGYMTWANILLGSKRLTILNNAGVSGQTSTQILARVESDVIAYSPGWCIVQGPTNDAPNFVSTADTITNLNEIYTRLLDAGIRVVAMSIIPLGSDHVNWSQQLVARIRQVNQWIADKCYTTPGMVFVDAWGAVVDPTQTDADPKTGYYFDSGPAVHPAALGAYYIGNAIKNSVAGFIPARDDMLSSDADDWASDVQTLTTLTGDGTTLTATLDSHRRLVGDVVTIGGANESGFNGQRRILTVPTTSTFTMAGTGSGTATGTVTVSAAQNLLDNGLFQGSAGTAGTGITGSVATGWTVDRDTGSPTAACTVDARSDGFGNDQTIVFDAAANGDIVRLRSPSVTSRVFSGDQLYAECAISATGITAINLVAIRLNVFVGSNYWRYDGGHPDYTDAFPTTDYSGVFRTPVITVPTGTVAQCRIDVIMRGSGSTGAATVKVGRARIVKVVNR